MTSAMTTDAEHAILESPATRRMVFEILALAEGRDPVDAAKDARTAAEILAARMDRPLNRAESNQAE